MYSPAVGKVRSTASSPGRPVGSGWTWLKVARSVRVAMRCIHASCPRVRSSTGSPVSVSTTETVMRVGDPGPDGVGQLQARGHAGLLGLYRGHLGRHHDAHRRAHRHPGGLGPREGAVHPALGEVHPADRGQGRADGQGDDADAGQVGVLPDLLAHRRVQDLLDGAGTPEAAQPQGVAEHADRAHDHCGGREHGVEQQPVPGVEGAGGDGDEQHVVAEGPRQALLHRADRAPGESDGRDDAAQVAADQGDVGCGDGDVGAGADGDAEVGLGQGGCVVDAVAGHRDDVALLLELGDLGGLVRGEHLGEDVGDADARRRRPGRWRRCRR